MIGRRDMLCRQELLACLLGRFDAHEPSSQRKAFFAYYHVIDKILP